MEELKCPICLDIFDDPRTLPCLHSFCLGCLEKSPTNHGCPLCHQAIFPSSSSSSLSKLPVNPFISNLLQAENEKKLDQNNLKCTICEENQAVEHCNLCPSFLCSSCSSFHKKSPLSKAHQTLSIEEYLKQGGEKGPSKPPSCLVHPGNELSLYCKTCQDAICLSCVFPDHNGHEMVKMEEISLDFKNEIKDAREPSLQKEKTVEQAIKTHQALLESITTNASAASSKIKRTFNGHHGILTRREEVLLKEVKEMENLKKKQLTLDKETLEFQLERFKASSSFAQTLLEKGSPHELASSSKVLLENFRRLKEEQINSTPFYDGSLSFTSQNLERLKGSISSFGLVDGNLASPLTSLLEPMGELQSNKSLPSGSNAEMKITAMTKESKMITRGGDLFTVEVFDPAGKAEQDVSLKDHQDGSYLLEFVVKEKGDYQVHASANGREIKGSPQTIKVTWASAEKSQIEPMGELQTKKILPWRSKAQLKIIAFDQFGERVQKGGDAFQVLLLDPNGKADSDVSLKDLNDGSYLVEFEASKWGDYQVHLSLHEKGIKGSPLVIPVCCFSPEKSEFKGGKTFIANIPASLTLALKDHKGDPLDLQNDKPQISLKMGATEQELTLTSQPNGEWQIDFTPTTPGDLEITITIQGIPWKEISQGFKVLQFNQTNPLYDAKRDGYSTATFHEKCNHAPATLTLISLSNGAIFGGYNPSNWQGSGYKSSPGAFLFSVTDGKGRAPKVYLLKDQNDGCAISGHPSNGPTFGGGHDLFIHLDSLANSYSNSSSYALPSETELAGSHTHWTFLNVQVFAAV